MDQEDTEPQVVGVQLSETEPASPFYLVAAYIDIPLAPRFQKDVRIGIEQVLAKWLTKYIPALGCVLLTVQYPVVIVGDNARLIDPTAICVVRVQMEGLGFRPVVGTKLTGRIVLETASNVSLLLYNTFSVTIDRPHLGSTADWRFDSKRMPEYPGVTANEPEQDFYAQQQQVDDDAAAEAGEETGKAPAEETAEQVFDVQPRGCWVNRRTKETLGGADGLLTFTVTSLTVSGLALTCHGSLLDDPFKQPTPEEPEERRLRFSVDLEQDDGDLPPDPSELPPPLPRPELDVAPKKRKEKASPAASKPKKRKKNDAAAV